MSEAVIVATARTPIGRANKGSLVDCRPDDLSALIIGAVLTFVLIKLVVLYAIARLARMKAHTTMPTKVNIDSTVTMLLRSLTSMVAPYFSVVPSTCR